jgi:hypothetical protein
MAFPVRTARRDFGNRILFLLTNKMVSDDLSCCEQAADAAPGRFQGS